MSYSEEEARLLRERDEAREKVQAWEARMKAITGADSPDAAGNYILALQADRNRLRDKKWEGIAALESQVQTLRAKCEQKNLAIGALLKHTQTITDDIETINQWLFGLAALLKTVIGPAFDKPKRDEA